MRGLDTIWTIQLLAAAKRLVTMAMWQSYSSAEKIESMVKAMDQASWEIRPKTPHTYPIVQKQIKRALRYDIAILGAPTANLIRPHIDQLHWQRNANYDDESFSQTYAFCELIGPMGHAYSKNLRFGMLYMAPGTLYPFHTHPADEVYYVLSGQARFKVPDRPWRVCPIGQFVFHDSNVPHQIESRESHVLALYWWRGDDVETMATLTE